MAPAGRMRTEQSGGAGPRGGAGQRPQRPGACVTRSQRRVHHALVSTETLTLFLEGASKRSPAESLGQLKQTDKSEGHRLTASALWGDTEQHAPPSTHWLSNESKELVKLPGDVHG